MWHRAAAPPPPPHSPSGSVLAKFRRWNASELLVIWPSSSGRTSPHIGARATAPGGGPPAPLSAARAAIGARHSPGLKWERFVSPLSLSPSSGRFLESAISGDGHVSIPESAAILPLLRRPSARADCCGTVTTLHCAAHARTTFCSRWTRGHYARLALWTRTD